MKRCGPLFAALAALAVPLTSVADPPSIMERLRTGEQTSSDAAVVVGIENYAFLPAVPYAMRDAEAFYTYLVYTRGVPATRVSLLTNDPTAKEIRKAVGEAAEQVGDGGILWVYFAGHGAAHPETGKRMILGVDVQGKVGSLDEAAYTVQLDEIDQLVEGSAAEHVVAVVDACYAGTGRDGKPLLEGKRLAVPAYASAPRAKVTHWTATSEDEVSGPFSAAQHGLFTYFVVGALRGWADGEITGEPDGEVTLAEAQQYTLGAVRTLGGGEQLPTLDDRDDLMARTLTRGATLEAGPDLAELMLAAREPSTPKPGAGEAVISAGSDDYLARLEELQRIKQEREAAEARMRTLTEEVMAERTRRVDAARTKLLAEATAAWQPTTELLELGGPEAVMAAEAYVDSFGSATITIDDYTEPVWVPEAAEARAWLARQPGGPPAATITAERPTVTGSGADPFAVVEGSL
ncbi:MAG: caspase family protein, partial [Deltaproteobacteria bacterium]|nr:caspase family protein [Deltaproteobacteria bacterium]